MEFNVKLQELRKQKGITQEELAQSLFVSRTAVSKWESGRGYPNIDSLKALAKYFGVTVDELLSGDELLTIASEDAGRKKNMLCSLVFGLLDLSVAMFFFLPFFGQQAGESIVGVSLAALNVTSVWLKTAYCVAVIAIAVSGVLLLALQNCQLKFFVQNKFWISLSLNTVGALLFIVCKQPYPAAFLFVLLIIKVLLLIKKQ